MTVVLDPIDEQQTNDHGGLLHHYPRFYATGIFPVVGDKALCGWVKCTSRNTPLPGEQECVVCLGLLYTLAL